MAHNVAAMTTKKQQQEESKKEERIVVRVDKPTVEWLKEKAEKEDCSIGRIIRLALRKAKEANSFNEADHQTGQLELIAA